MNTGRGHPATTPPVDLETVRRSADAAEQGSSEMQLAWPAGLLVSALSVLANIDAMPAVGLGLVAFLLVRFLAQIKVEPPVDTLMGLVASIQWILAPLLAYKGLSDHYKYRMYVEQADYMSLAVPGTFCFVLGLFLFSDRERPHRVQGLLLRSRDFLSSQPYLPFLFIVAGTAASAILAGLPPSLRFAAFLISNMKYVGLIYLLLTPTPFKWPIIAGAIVMSAATSLSDVMFHDLLLWIVMISMYVICTHHWRMRTCILLLLAGVCGVFVIESVKADLREQLWTQHYDGSPVALFAELLEQKTSEGLDALVSPDVIETVVIRLNQGWIISRIVEQVPDHRPFAEGETIVEALNSSFGLRLLSPDKAGAGGRDNFPRFTGFELRGTSMGLSLLGEGYGNFGRTGAYVFMLVWGLVIAAALRLTLRLCETYPTLILWIPAIFLHAIKAETELIVVLNYLIKSGVVVVATLWCCRVIGARV